MLAIQRVAIGAALVLVATLAVGAAPAQAHNVLISSDPADGATLAVPPERITLTFDDAVLAVGVALEVVGPEGPLVLPALTVDGAVVSQPLPAALGAGEYGVAWRVTSADGHPIDGTLTFTASASSVAPGTVPTAGPGATATSTAPDTTTPTDPAPTDPAPTDPATPGTQPPATAGDGEDQAAEGENGDDEQAGGLSPAVWVLAALVVAALAVPAWLAVRRSRSQH